MNPESNRRASDSGGGLWNAVDQLRLDIRMLAPLTISVAQQGMEISTVREFLEGFEERSRERFNKIDEQLEQINANGKLTNGRLTGVERKQAIDEALAVRAAGQLEEVRAERALLLAKGSWKRPTFVGGAVSLLVLVCAKLLGLA